MNTNMNAIEIHDLAKSFNGSPVLDEISFKVRKGEIFGYLGPNGSGKTTTMHCMVGLVKPDAGEVEIFGRSNDPNKPEWKLDIGYVGDKHVFYENWSGEKNLKFLKQFYPNWDTQLEQDLIKRFEVPISKRAKDLSQSTDCQCGALKAYCDRTRESDQEPKRAIERSPLTTSQPSIHSVRKASGYKKAEKRDQGTGSPGG